MKKIRLICPNCQQEQTSTEDEQNITTYSEELVYQSCPDCIDNPKAKLLNAIFGQEQGNCSLWKKEVKSNGKNRE